MTRRGSLYCSFCGRPEIEVRKLISGPNWTFICDLCVLDAVRIVAEKYPTYRAKIIAELDAAAQREIAAACRAVTTGIEDREG